MLILFLKYKKKKERKKKVFTAGRLCQFLCTNCRRQKLSSLCLQLKPVLHHGLIWTKELRKRPEHDRAALSPAAAAASAQWMQSYLHRKMRVMFQGVGDLACGPSHPNWISTTKWYGPSFCTLLCRKCTVLHLVVQFYYCSCTEVWTWVTWLGQTCCV